jgi:hypothetical protein
VQAVTGDEPEDLLQKSLLILVRPSSVASVQSSLEMELSIERLIGGRCCRKEWGGLRECYQHKREHPTLNHT